MARLFCRMEVVPLLKVRSATVMVGPPGDLRRMPKPYLDGGDDVKGLVRHLFSRFGSVAVVDYGGAFSIEPNLNLYQRVARGNVLLWFDAFPETMEDVMDLFVGGGDRVTVRVDIMDPQDLRDVLQIADGEIFLGYPYTDHAELKALLKEHPPASLLQQGARGIVLLDHAEHERGEPDREAVTLVRDLQVPVFLAGGVRHVGQLDALKEAGYAGVLVGDALMQDPEPFLSYAKKEGSIRGSKEPEDLSAKREGDPGAPPHALGGTAATVGGAGLAGGMRDNDSIDDST
jgi:hypothetical protein